MQLYAYPVRAKEQSTYERPNKATVIAAARLLANVFAASANGSSSATPTEFGTEAALLWDPSRGQAPVRSFDVRPFAIEKGVIALLLDLFSPHPFPLTEDWLFELFSVLYNLMLVSDEARNAALPRHRKMQRTKPAGTKPLALTTLLAEILTKSSTSTSLFLISCDLVSLLASTNEGRAIFLRVCLPTL